MQTLFSRLGAVRCLFFKSEQFQLIDMPIHVGASVDKHGHVKAAHTRIQKVRVEKPTQPDMFGQAEEPTKADKHAVRLDAFIRKHGGLGNLAHLMAGMTDGQQQRIFEEMGKLGGKSVVEVAAMFDNVKPEPAQQADLFAAPDGHDRQEHRYGTNVDESAMRGYADAKAGKPKIVPGDIAQDDMAASAWLIGYRRYDDAIDTSPKRVEKIPENEHEIVEYTTRKGKTLRGIVRADLTQDEAKAIDEYTFKHQGGWFIREKHLGKLNEVQQIKPVISENPQNSVGKKPKRQDKEVTASEVAAIQDIPTTDKMIEAVTTVGEDEFAQQVADKIKKYKPSNEHQEAMLIEATAIEIIAKVRRTTPFGVQAGISKQARRDLNAQAAAIVARGGEYSEADKGILRQYSGNGGCGDSLNEFYTLPEVASAMWSVAQRLGAKGDVLEPSCGPGVFLHTAPTGSKVTGIEMDETSAKIARALHGDRHEIANASLERFATQDERQYDAVLGNVPFGLRGSLIKDDKPNLKTADAYFCDTSMDKCKAGGIVGLIVPTGIMDSRTNRKLRETLLRKGQFLGAQRMPNTAFEHSHTEVTTDVVWFRKFPDDVAGALSTKAVSQDNLKTLGLWDDEFLAGGYFTGRGAENILGKMGDGWRAKAGMGADITVEGSMKDVPEALRAFAPEEQKAFPGVTDILAAVGSDAKAHAVVLGGAMNRPYADKSKVGDTKTVDGIAYVLQGKPPRWHRIDEVLQSEALTQGQYIAARIDLLMSGMGAVDRYKLEADTRAWVEEHGIPAKHKDILLGVRADKTLYRLIGAVKSDGTLSDAVMGKAAAQSKGSFEATITSLLNDHETVGVDKLAKAAELDTEEALDQLYGSPKYAIDAGTGEWTTKDIYLSGDLWAKSDAVKDALSGDGLAPELRKKLEQQSALLVETIAPVSLEDAFIQLNSAFLPTSVLSEFLTQRYAEKYSYDKDPKPTEVTFGEGVYTITGGSPWAYSDLLKYLNRSGLRKDDKHIIDDLNIEFKDWLCASPEYREQVENLYNRKFRGFQEREFSNEPMDIPGMNTDGLKDYQWGGLRWALNAGKGIIAADVGLGKAQPLDAKILTPAGWKLMGDIQVGDEVIAGDGTVTLVTGVFPQGEKEIFKVTMSDGASTECCDEHLWLTQTTKERNNQRRGSVESGKPKVRPLSEIRVTLQNLGREKNHAIPIVDPVEFAHRDVLIDPYLLGVLIGDGTLKRGTPLITSPELEIIEALRVNLPDGYALNEQKSGEWCKSYNLCRSVSNKLHRNYFTSAIAGYGLNELSNGKFVPDDYKFNTPSVRLSILQGLMDTNGYVDPKGVTVQFTSVSERLANDVQFLVNSLGGNATIKSKIPTFTYKGEKKQGQRAYTVHLRLPPSVAPFLHSVKRKRVVPKSKYQPVRYIVGAVSVGIKQAQCISVAHESHLYVTDDFIVTHNTVRALMLARMLKTTGQAKRPMIVVPKSVLANWHAECEKWFPGSKVLTIGGSFERLSDGTVKGRDENAAERKRKYHDLQQNDYDFIICSEPSFEELDLDPITKGELNSKDFWVQRSEKMEKAGDKRANAIREAWNQARANQEFGKETRTDATYFNGLGVDALIHDEFHHQKNLCSIKSRFGESPKYMGGGGQSMRSLDFNLKARWLLEQQDGKNVYGLTATPTKNSPIEIYAMLSHVAPEAFEKIGVRNSEEFIDRFARLESGMALNTGGMMEEALITAGFKNMDELRTIMKRYIHRQTAEEVGLQLPERQDVMHMIDMDEAQQAQYSELRDLAAKSGGKDATGDAHIFSIMDKMNKTAVDLSLLDPNYDGAKSPKYTACAQEIIKNMKDGGQIVFSDYVDSHEKIATALVASGIPRNQIGIINAQAASSSSKRQSICDAFNAGKLKVVIGNTATMGEGLNLQKGTSDIHHLDLPWEPASMQQRNGRGLRQGNTNNGVRIHAYLAKGSFDGYRLQAILAKKDWQDAVWKGGNEVENLNRTGDMSRDELMIMLAADPDQARAAFESNHKAKEERLIAGKATEAAQRFVKFQEIKRSYGALKSKDNQSAARLKARLDKEYSGLKADKYFTAKQALDLDTPVIVANTGVMLHAGAGIELGEGDRYIITAVNQRNQTVSMRKYGDEKQAKREVNMKELPMPKAFAYDEAVETAEINKRIAEQPLEIKSLGDVNKLPASVITANHAKLQEQLWAGAKDYSISLSSVSKVPMLEKATGKPVLTDSYNITGSSKKEEFNPENYDFLLPTEENKAKVKQAWMDAERGAQFGTKHAHSGNRRNQKTTTTASRNYGSSIETGNPWRDTLNDLHGGKKYYGYESDSPTIKAAKGVLHAEQLERIRHARTFSEALDAAAPLGEIVNKEKGHGASVKLPKRAVATLWAKARQEGVLGALMGMHEPQKENHGYKSSKHSQYFTDSNGRRSVHSALLGMAVTGGYDDLVRAMVESGLRHHKDGKHEEALQSISQGYTLHPDRIHAMQKLAGAAGLLDKKRSELFSPNGNYGELSLSAYGGGAERDQTVGDRLAELLAESSKNYDKEPA